MTQILVRTALVHNHLGEKTYALHRFTVCSQRELYTAVEDYLHLDTIRKLVNSDSLRTLMVRCRLRSYPLPLKFDQAGPLPTDTYRSDR